jgi:hypothetical protein
MARIAGGALGLVVVLATGLAWALSTGDSGALWVQASSTQKNAVVNILSRELSVDPGKLQACLVKLFSEADNAKLSIQDAAKKCKDEEIK